MTVRHRLRRLSLVALGLTLATGLTACSSLGITEEAPPVCPDLRIDRDTAEITVFNGSGTDLTDLRFEASIADINGDCDFEEADEGEGGTVHATFNVLFAVSRGPAMDTQEGHFTYFVALPSFYPADAAKQTLPVDFTFPEGNVTTMMLRDEEVEISIPVDSPTAAADIPVYVGFQLTRAQLEFNRHDAN